jgi:SPP1 gp7 family putative phage head morphogenesis protein
VTTKDAWSKEIRAKIQDVLETYFFAPLLDATKETRLDNAVPKTILELIKAGLVWYDGAYFRGKRSAAISKQLRDMGAVFSQAEHAWRFPENRMSPALREAITARRMQAQSLSKQFSDIVTRLQKQMQLTAPNLNFDVEAAKTDRALQKEMQRKVPASVSIVPVLNDEQKAHMATDYSENVALSIVGFVDSEVERFRKQVLPQIQKGMDRRDLADYIEDRLGVSKDRAKFIARQETALFSSKLREVQYRKAGIEKYKWRAIGGRSGDGRTRDEHMKASGKEFYWDHSKNLNPVLNSDRVPVHPGEDFGCRCQAIPIVEEIV